MKVGDIAIVIDHVGEDKPTLGYDGTEQRKRVALQGRGVLVCSARGYLLAEGFGANGARYRAWFHADELRAVEIKP